MPIDMDPDRYRGNIRINPDQTIEVLGPLEATACRLDGDALYISHFTTCPHAKQHRRNQ